MTPQRFSLASRLLHWTMAPLLVAMLLIGTGMVTTMSRWHNILLGLHKPLGLALLALALLRLALRLVGKTPPLPSTLPAPLRIAAKASHWLLYGCMLAMPLIGWGMLSAAGYPMPSPAGLHIPPLLAPDVERFALLRTLHAQVGRLFFALVTLHIMAGLLHALLLRDGVFDAMSLRGKR
jgi:cytochrome b561